MLETVNLKKTMIDSEYKQLTRSLKEELARLQHRVKEEKIPVIILFEGWGAAGKGSLISDMILNLDPRNFKSYSTVAPTSEERRKPFLWRHWNRIPPRGQMVILDRSWYPEISTARIEEHLSDAQFERRVESIRTFERQLTDDGYLIIKFFLHISQHEQEKRLKKLRKSKETAWRATDLDFKRNRKYDAYLQVFDEMLERTQTPDAPWHIIGSHDRNSAMAEIYKTAVESIQEALAAKEEKKAAPPAAKNAPIDPGAYALVKMQPLSKVRLDMTVEEEEYRRELKKCQKRLGKLHNRLYLEKIPVVTVYEGWDAAGKGGNIKRLVKSLDPRGYEVIPVAAPSAAELAHHYLWRFWKEVPKQGHITIFDRSWYGRVMVERIEGFCTPEEWRRAYKEINEFEAELAEWGAVILKFWIHIDKDEQLRRFKDREDTPEKRWKITDEDWRNREKWEQYETAVDDMLKNTSTAFAPWTIIESQDKRFARLKAIKAFIDAVEERL